MLPTIVLAVLDDAGSELPARLLRAEVLRDELRSDGALIKTRIVRVRPGTAFALAELAPAAIVAVGFAPDAMRALTVLSIPLLWDAGGLEAGEVGAWLDEPTTRETLSAILAATAGVIELSEEPALVIEDGLKVGISTHGVKTLVAAALEPICVIIGAGLGNMIYGVPTVRWLAERHGRPIDVIVHDRFDEGVSLFARSTWIRTIFPGFEYVAGKHYKTLICNMFAGAMRPPVTADQVLWLDQDYDYNIESRFVPECRVNFVGLARLYGEDPALAETLPLPFIRDIEYRHGGKRIIGIANGKKSAAWAKREWPHMEALVAELTRKGWEVRSFGLPDEYVPGAVDRTGLPIREVLRELSECSFFLSFDGGLCHMASGMGVPTIWLFGSTGSMKNGPAFAHDRVLLCYRECGPCLYREDWNLCNLPLCMNDITLDQVIATLEDMESSLATHGHHPKPRARDGALLEYELGALYRPGPEQNRQRYLSERVALTVDDQLLTDRLLLALAGGGDVQGTVSLAKAAIARWGGTRVTRFLLGVAEHGYPANTPLDALSPQPEPLSIDEIDDFIRDVIALELTGPERRLIVEMIVRRCGARKDHPLMIEALRRLLLHPLFRKDLDRLLRRALFRCLSQGRYEAEVWQEVWESGAAQYGSNPSLVRMFEVLHRDVGRQLYDRAVIEAELLDMTAEQVLEAGMAPHRARISKDVQTPGLLLDLGTDHRYELSGDAVVILLVPHVQRKSPLPGSAASLILMQAQRLAVLGLRPLIVTVGYDNVPDGWEVRDSVSYIQAHRSWSKEQFAPIFDIYRPELVLGYGEVLDQITLPPTEAPIVPVTVDGLFDLNGLLMDFDISAQWARARQTVSKVEGDVPANRITQSLFNDPDGLRPVPAGPMRALVLLPDASEFPAFMRLVTAMPSVEFTVMSALKARGAEKNVRFVPPLKMPDKPGGIFQMLLQFSTRPVSIAAEIVTWIETGGLAVALSQDMSQERGGKGTGLTDALAQVGGSGTTLDWIQAIERTARCAALSETELLAD